MSAKGGPGRRGALLRREDRPRDLAGRESPPRALLQALAAIPEETLWIERHHSPYTRKAYRAHVAEFMRFLGIRTSDELRLVGQAAVVAWKRALEERGAKPTTVRTKLAALSSLFSHLVRQQVLRFNPCADIERPEVNRREGTTAAFSTAEAKRLMDAPDPLSLEGLRDRAILSLGLQAGPRRSSIVRLKVRDFHRSQGFDCLRFTWKGGRAHVLPLHASTAQRIREYLEAAGHGEDLDGPLFRPLRRASGSDRLERALSPEAINRILKRYCRELGIEGRFSAHSMRTTFITRTLENGASLEEVQRAAGHADPDTTKLYDRRGFNPERAATFFANY